MAKEQGEQGPSEEPKSPEERGEDEEEIAERAEDASVEGPPEQGAEEETPSGEAEGAEPSAQDPPAEPAAPAPDSGPPAGEQAKGDLPPGADLDPIALEPQAKLSTEERARLEAEAEERARREAEATAEAGEEEPTAAPRAPAQLSESARYLATGKRKRSIARVIITPGEGRFEVNRREVAAYFPRPLHQSMVKQPLVISGYEGGVNVRVRVRGGGVSGQAGAVRHGVARALTEIDPELRRDMKRRGFLTRDARVKERRKAGLKKARKRPQFSKR